RAGLRCAGGHGCRAGRAPAHADRVRVPELQPASRADGARERAVARLLRRWSAGRGAARPRGARSRRPLGQGGRAACRAFRRRAPARRHRARSSRPSSPAARRRTHGQSRRQYRGRRDRSLPAAPPRGDDAPDRHPRGPGLPCRDPHPGAARRRPPSRRGRGDGDGMRTGKLIRLARGNLVRELGALAVSSGGVALGIGCLVFFLALGAGLQGVVNEVFPVSTREVEVVVPAMAIGNLLGEARLDDAVVARLRKVPGVAAAYPKMSLRIPAVTRYNGLFFGRGIHMGLEVVGVGLMPELVGEDARLPFQDRGDGAPIPIVVSRRLLEIYNKVFAPQRGLPRLTDSMLIGFQFPIELGRSYIAGKTMPNAQEAALQLVGFSDRATLAGASMPLTAVMRINRRYGADADNYSSV